MPFLLFSNDKAQLHRWRLEIIDFLQTLRLELHEGKSAVLPLRLGVDFVGFRIFPTHRRLRRQNVRRAFRRMRNLRDAYRAGEIPLDRVNTSVQSWIAHSQHASTYGLRRSLFRQMVFQSNQVIKETHVPIAVVS